MTDADILKAISDELCKPDAPKDGSIPLDDIAKRLGIPADEIRGVYLRSLLMGGAG